MHAAALITVGFGLVVLPSQAELGSLVSFAAAAEQLGLKRLRQGLLRSYSSVIGWKQLQGDPKVDCACSMSNAMLAAC